MHTKQLIFLFTITLLTLLCFSMVSSKAIKRNNKTSCTKSRMCKYGGKCDSLGTCRCNFECSPSLWPTRMYCGPKPKGDGSARKYFMNLCQLLAQACEDQRDIPIIKFSMDLGRCEDEIPPPIKLCSDPKDFMGPCGGTASAAGSLTAGICLREVATGMQRCECPSTKTGWDCQAQVVRVRSLHSLKEEEVQEDTQSPRFPTSVAIYGSFSFLLFVFLLYNILKRYRSDVRKRRQQSNDITQTSTTERFDNAEKKLDDSSVAHLKMTSNLQSTLLEQKSTASSKVDSLIVYNPGKTQRQRLSACTYVSLASGADVAHSSNTDKKIPTNKDVVDAVKGTLLADDLNNNNSNQHT